MQPLLIRFIVKDLKFGSFGNLSLRQALVYSLVDFADALEVGCNDIRPIV